MLQSELTRCKQCIADLQQKIQTLESDHLLKDRLLLEKRREIAYCTAENLKLMAQIRRLQSLHPTPHLGTIPSDSDLTLHAINMDKAPSARRDTPTPSALTIPISRSDSTDKSRERKEIFQDIDIELELDEEYQGDVEHEDTDGESSEIINGFNGNMDGNMDGNILSVPSTASSSLLSSPRAPVTINDVTDTPVGPVHHPVAISRLDLYTPVNFRNLSEERQQLVESPPVASHKKTLTVTMKPHQLSFPISDPMHIHHISCFAESKEISDSELQEISLFLPMEHHRKCTPPLAIEMSDDNHTISNQWGDVVASVDDEFGVSNYSQISEDPDSSDFYSNDVDQVSLSESSISPRNLSRISSVSIKSMKRRRKGSSQNLSYLEHFVLMTPPSESY